MLPTSLFTFLACLMCLAAWAEGKGEGRQFAVSALDYQRRYNRKLKLGDCIYSGASGYSWNSGYRFVGNKKFIDNPQSNIEFHRLNTMLDTYSRTKVSLSVAVDFLGLAPAKVTGTVTVTVKTKKNTLSMEAKLKVNRGTDTITNVKPSPQVLLNSTRCPYYLSEIAYGGEDRMVVSFEFEEKTKTTEVELKITVKVLFFKISIKMRWMKTEHSFSGRVQISRYSSYDSDGPVRKRVFGKHDFALAAAEVARAEEEMENLPTRINRYLKDDLHEIYFFAKSVIDNTYRPAIISRQYAYTKARLQLLELQGTRQDINSDINTRVIVIGNLAYNEQKNLKQLKETVEKKYHDLEGKLRSFQKLSASDVRALKGIYGRDKAPGYYARQHRLILPEKQYTVCRNVTASGLADELAVNNLGECTEKCEAKLGCKAFVWKPYDKIKDISPGKCSFQMDAKCSTTTTVYGEMFVLMEHSPCSPPKGACMKQYFVE